MDKNEQKNPAKIVSVLNPAGWEPKIQVQS